MQSVTLDEASQKLESLIAAAVQGETILITTEDAQVVRLVPVQRSRQPRQFGSAKGLIRMAEDFEEPLDDFSEYTI